MTQKLMDCCEKSLDEFFDDFIPDQMLLSALSTAQTIADIIVNLERYDLTVGLGLKRVNEKTYTYIINVGVVDENQTRIVHINSIPILLCPNKKLAEKILERTSDLINESVREVMDDKIKSKDTIKTQKKSIKIPPCSKGKMWN